MEHRARTTLHTDICETFRSLAFRTFDQMGRALRVGHQPLEETFTDINLLELKDRHPYEIRCHTFSKPQEGKNGADWEWWLTDAQRTLWLGMRIQAKVLNIKSNTFPHLHYKTGKFRGYQSVKLKRQCAADGLIALYCFYLHQHPKMLSHARGCGSFAPATEAYGCSLAPMSLVESLRLRGEINTFNEVIEGSHPRHCLVCCSGYGGGTLPERAWSFLQSASEPLRGKLFETAGRHNHVRLFRLHGVIYVENQPTSDSEGSIHDVWRYSPDGAVKVCSYSSGPPFVRVP